MIENVRIASLGITAEASVRRASKSGVEYDHLFPHVDWQTRIVRKNGTVKETVEQMRGVIYNYLSDVAKIAPLLKGRTVEETCEKVWNFLYEHIRYKEDDKGQEQLRRAARGWAERRRGIDCDDFTIFACALLIHLNIPGITIRIARYAGKDYFQHVYAVVKHKGQEIVIDAVLDNFNEEKEFIENRDYKLNTMETSNLNGIDIAVLSGVEDDYLQEQIAGILSGSDFEALEQMEGLGRVPTDEQALNAIYSHLVKTRDLVERNPELISSVEEPRTFLKMLDYAIRYWHTDKRSEALEILAQNEDKINVLSGIENEDEQIELFFGTDSLGSVRALGKVKARRNFFKNILNTAKNVTKKVAQGAKTVAKAVVRYNPLSVAARNGFLLAMKLNLFQLAEKLKWAYMSEAEASQYGLDMGEWKNLKNIFGKVEDMFTKVLQGKIENLKDAILKGKAGGLNGITLSGSLGAEPITTGATTGAAATFLAKVGAWLKGLNIKKLLSKVNPLKLFKRKDKTGEEAAASEQLPEGSEYYNETGDENKPAFRTTNAPEGDTPPEGEKDFFDKIIDFAKENPVPVIGGGLLLGYLLWPKKKTALGKVNRRGKKRKTKSRKPKTLSGVKALPPRRAKKKGGKKRRNTKPKIWNTKN